MERKLYEKVKLSDLLTSNGYVVAIEGDSDLYDEDLAIWLKNNVKNYILLSEIYDNPEKLLTLKNIKIDVFLFQTTGANPKLQQLIDHYIENVGNFPRHFISVNEDKGNVFKKIFEKLPTYDIYDYYDIENNKLLAIRTDRDKNKL